jgi:hypothetical protein
MHLDPRPGVVPARDMAQLVERDRAAELAFDAPRDVEVGIRR